MARLGVVTASEVDQLVTPLWKPREGKGVETYLYRKLAEKLVGYIPDFAGTQAMDLGSMAEKLALPWFNGMYDVNARQVGFCVSDDGRIGCSPDALIGDDSGLEIKFPTPPMHLKYLVRGEVPEEYLPQCHFAMLVTGRPTWNFMSFSTQFDPLILPVKRDEAIQQKLRVALDGFFAQFDPLYARFKGAVEADNATKAAEYEVTISKEMLAAGVKSGELAGEKWLRERQERGG